MRTNSEMLRAMTDEELAHVLIGLSDLDERIGFCQELEECTRLLDTDEGIPAEKCERCMLNWLQKPLEEKYG